MSNYQPASGSVGYNKHQEPGALPDNAYDRTSKPARCTFTKSPNYVLITKTMTKPFGFYFGNETGFNSGSANSSDKYDIDYGAMPVGTRLDLHPSAWSGSSADDGSVRVVYRSGLSTGGR